MGLIQDLQTDILNPEMSLSSILRKAKVLASLLRNDELKRWVDNELDGYPGDSKDIPDYRQARAENFGFFVGPFGMRLENAPIPALTLPESMRKFAQELVFYDGVRGLESLLKKEEPSALKLVWPADMVALVSDRIYDRLNCISAWKVVPSSLVEQVLDAVRNRLLGFVLELRERYPEVARSEEAISEVPRDQVRSAVNTYIYGSHNIVASGTQITQERLTTVERGDLESLAAYMRSIGVPETDVSELGGAIKEDGKRLEGERFGTRVKSWVATMTGKILEGTWKVAIETAPGLLTKALSRYYGWE